MDKFTRRSVSRMDKVVVGVASLTFLILSVLFYRERIAFADTAAYTSHIIARNSFEIAMHSRFVGALSQIFIYLGIQIGLPLKTLLILYSLNFALIPVGCALISVRWFRETRTAWSILLFYTLMSFHMFYYPVSEYQIGLGLFLFYIGAYHFYKEGGINTFFFTLLSLVFIPAVIFCHPLGVLVFICWVVLQLSDERGRKRTLGLLTLAGIVAFCVKRLFFSIGYEEQKSSAIRNFMKFSFQDLHQQLGKSSLEFILKDYFLLVVLTVATMFVLFRQNRKMTAVLLPLILAAWWVLVTVSFIDEQYDHYYEHMYQAIPFFVSLAFCTIVLPLPAIGLRTIMMATIMIISFSKIINGRHWHQERFAWMQRCFDMMDGLHCKKVIVTIEYVPGEWNCIAAWSIPYESLLLSSLENSDKSKVILIKGSLYDAEHTGNELYDIDPLPGFPLLKDNYFRITGTQYCIPQKSMEYKIMEQIKTGIQK